MAASVGRTIAGVSVGVDRTGLLTPLTAAASSAVEFHEWMLSQKDLGVDVDAALLTDQKGVVVSHRNVTDAISSIIQKRACDTMFLYLSGHGVISGGYQEKFLLSDVDRSANEAIDIQLSILDAKRCNIPHVVFIYDACRSIPTAAKLTRIGGSSVVERKDGAAGGHVDVFFACAPDDSAYEIPLTRQAFFTQVLLEILKTPPVDLVEETTIRKKTVPVIPSFRLEQTLKNLVPLRARSVTPPFNQLPDIETPSHLPEFFAVSSPPPGVHGSGDGADNGPVVGRVAGHTEGSAGVVQSYATKIFNPRNEDLIPGALRNLAAKSGFDRVFASMSRARGREGFETHTGFTIIGTRVARVNASNNLRTELEPDYERPDATHIRVGQPPWDVTGGTAIIQFSNGGGVVLGIMPGYIGTVVIGENGSIDALAYSLSRGTLFYDQYKAEEAQLQERRALASATAAVSKLQQLAKSEGIALADHVRVDKGFDPALGILAAYAYYLAEDQNNVQSVFGWMAQTRVNPYNENPPILAPVPFDVAMLADHLDYSGPNGIAPCCPMFSFGWSLLERFKAKLPSRILEAGNFRRPGTWSSFDPEGIQHFQDALEKGEVR